MLVAVLLLRYKDFLDVLAQEPRNKFANPSVHPFVARVEETLEDAQLSVENFNKWQEQVKDGFNNRNFAGLSINKQGIVINGVHRSVYVDQRPFMSVIDNMATATDSVRVHLAEQDDLLKEQQRAIKTLTAQNLEMKSMMERMATKLDVLLANTNATNTRVGNVLPGRSLEPGESIELNICFIHCFQQMYVFLF